jgi:hypothetical protein
MIASWARFTSAGPAGRAGEDHSMTAVHQTVGTLVLLAFLGSLIVNGLGLTGRTFTWGRYVSMAGSALLLLQIVLGFSLLGEGEENAAAHYVLAILALLSLGLEHGYARSQPTAEGRFRWGAIANAITLVLVLITYIVGPTTAS